MAEKGGVSPLVLFKGLTGNGQEVAHRELRLGVCGAEREGRRRVRWRTPGRCSNPALEVPCVSVAPEHPPPPPPPKPTGGLCSNERPRQAPFPLTLFALCELLLPPDRTGTSTSTEPGHTLSHTAMCTWSPYSQRTHPHASDRMACL